MNMNLYSSTEPKGIIVLTAIFVIAVAVIRIFAVMAIIIYIPVAMYESKCKKKAKEMGFSYNLASKGMKLNEWEDKMKSIENQNKTVFEIGKYNKIDDKSSIYDDL